MKINLLLLCLVFLAGCVQHTGPEHAESFKENLRLTDLQGVYKNKGEPEGYLSSALWGQGPQTYSDDRSYWIDKIEVVPESKTVTVRAVAGECYIFQKRYVEGKDFTIEHGRITIRNESALLNSGTGDPLVGPRYAEISIGLDASGNGMSRDDFLATGLVYLVLPVALYFEADTRYERLSATPVNYPPCKDQLEIGGGAR